MDGLVDAEVDKGSRRLGTFDELVGLERGSQLDGEVVRLLGELLELVEFWNWDGEITVSEILWYLDQINDSLFRNSCWAKKRY